MNPITNLPSSVVVHILSNFVHLKDLVRLDSAFLIGHQHDEYRSLCNTSGFILRGAVNVSHTEDLLWPIAQNIRASTIQLDRGGNFDRQSFYLREHGKHVTGATVQSIAGVNLVKAHCSNLVSIFCQNMALFPETSEFLLKCPKLQEFHCKDCSGDLEPVFANTGLPHLHTLTVTCKGAGWRASDDIEPAVKSAGGKLLRLELSHILRDDIFRVENLFEHCPQLTSLGLLSARVGSETFAALVSKCPNIVHLSLRGCSDTTDDDLRTLVQDLPLRVLNIEKCNKLTAQSLEYIQEHSHSTLEGLYLESADNFSIHDVTTMLLTCPHILHPRALSWTGQGQWGNTSNAHNAQLFALSRHRVHNLVLSEPLQTEQILCAVAENCANLRTLDLRRPAHAEYPAEGILL